MWVELWNFVLIDDFYIYYNYSQNKSSVVQAEEEYFPYIATVTIILSLPDWVDVTSVSYSSIHSFFPPRLYVY